ncbi:DNA-directed RNA polymerase subunit beta', partial [Rhizoctonia solani]
MSTGAAFAYSSVPLRKVKEVQFGILSPEEIKAYSVCKIEFPEVLEEGTGKVKTAGLMDPRLGTVDRNFKCQTCGEGMAECPGHFGHIELARPVFHIGTFNCTLDKFADIVSEYYEASPSVPPPDIPVHFLGALSASRRTPSHLLSWFQVWRYTCSPCGACACRASARLRSLDRRVSLPFPPCWVIAPLDLGVAPAPPAVVKWGDEEESCPCRDDNRSRLKDADRFERTGLARADRTPRPLTKAAMYHLCTKFFLYFHFISMANDTQFAEKIRHVRDPKKRMALVWAHCKGKMICEADETKDDEGAAAQPAKVGHGGCGHVQPLIRKEGLKLFLVYKKGRADDEEMDGRTSQPEKRLYPASDVYNTLKKIPDSDLALLGLSEEFARPDWMILTVLPVPPPPVRPSISADGGTVRSEDDLTYKLGDILKASINVRRCEEEGSPAHVISEFEQLLQFHVATYMDNDIAGIPQALQKSGRPVKAIRARLKGKEGRLRGNLMGKRVDFSARTVITGDPNLMLDEVGVPRSMAMNLTYPERVTPYNIEWLQMLVRNGPREYPGARYVVRDSGERIDLRYNKRADTSLQYGWIVERHLKNGDYVLFNRQPSLHKMSMMSHRVKIMPYSTFRLNLSVTPPYNADFDGDEMNMHIPQSEETRAELSQIAWVPRQIISPQANKPVMGIVQDTLCGIRKITLRDNFLDWNFVQNILLWVPEWDGQVPVPTILKPKPLWTGKQILSLCIPSGINVFRAPDKDKRTNRVPANPANDDGICIENGEILYGVVEKKTVGASQAGLIHITFREKGPEITRDLFTSLQKVVNFWLLHNGFSIGIGDTIADKDTMSKITIHIETAKNNVLQLIQKAQYDGLRAEPGMTIRESFESHVNRELNMARDKTGKDAQDSLKNDNNVKQMVVAGSKGSFINISQMSGCVGQQSVEGKRIPFGFKHRTLPHFNKDDYCAESRGFVENSYLRGLTPQEFFFHAMAGREGLIDTAVKTAETGYIQRRLVKAMEDIAVCYDGTVRNSLGDIVQFAYGEDGMDGAFIERQSVEPYRLSNRAFERKYRVDVLEAGSGFSPGTLQVGLDASSPELQYKLDNEYAQLVKDRKMLREFIFKTADPNQPHYLPVNLRRVIQNAQQIFHIDRRKPSDLEPAYIMDEVAGLSSRLIVVRGEDPISLEAQDNATMLFNMHLRSTFATRPVLEELRLTKQAFDWIIGEVETKFNASIVNPGEMCGTLAAQSIGEPATQMTLNTFHYAGVSSKNVTLGVPRLKEIINVATNIKTPSLTVYLQSEYASSKHKAKTIQTELAHTTLRTITATTEIIYDPDPTNTIIDEDRDFVETFFAIPDESVERTLSQQSPWVLRIQLDRAKVLDKKLDMAYIADRIEQAFYPDMKVIPSDDNAEKLILRCRPIVMQDKDEEAFENTEEDIFIRQIEHNMLDSVTLRGVKGIRRVFMVEHDKPMIDAAGELQPRSAKEWVLETDGVNLKSVLSVDGIDFTRTYSNKCPEVFEVLGIEAARAAILRELRNVIEFDGSYVNYRHLALLTDLMTNRGTLMAITRHGINRADTGALMRCSFEETVEILMEAAAVGEKDDCYGVAENVLFGQMAPMGTGSFDVALDVDMLKDVIVDSRLPIQNMMAAQMGGGATPAGGLAMTPYDSASPMQAEAWRTEGAAFSPLATNADEASGGFSFIPFGQSPMGPDSRFGGYSPSSPGYSPTSPFMPTSPMVAATSPYGASPFGATSPYATSPAYSPTSPNMNLTSPQYSPTSPQYSPTSPTYSPTSPTYSPTSPRYYSTSPSFSPASPRYSPTSPRYSPTSPMQASPTSPKMTSPRYSPTSPTYSPASPAYTPVSPAYSPTSPVWSPRSPAPGDSNNQNQQNQTNGQTSPWGNTATYQASPSWK